MDDTASNTRQKALALNLEATTYGTFAEIGAGQEVARWFFSVGGAAGTVAKSISAYDMAVSTELYGLAQRYVSRERLGAMVEEEFAPLVERLAKGGGGFQKIFVLPEKAAGPGSGQPEKSAAWVGNRFPTSTH